MGTQMKARELYDLAVEWGWTEVRTKGGHTLMEHPDHPYRVPITSPGRSTTAAGGSIKNMAKAMGLTLNQFLDGPTDEKRSELTAWKEDEARLLAEAEARIRQETVKQQATPESDDSKKESHLMSTTDDPIITTTADDPVAHRVRRFLKDNADRWWTHREIIDALKPGYKTSVTTALYGRAGFAAKKIRTTDGTGGQRFAYTYTGSPNDVIERPNRDNDDDRPVGKPVKDEPIREMATNATLGKPTDDTLFQKVGEIKGKTLLEDADGEVWIVEFIQRLEV